MNSGQTATEVTWDPPGPGPWELDPVHFPRPATRYWVEMHPEPFLRGTSEFTRFYGMLLDGLEYRYVNGFAYSSARPVPDEEVPKRFERAAEAIEKKLWREQLRDWDETFKPQSISKHRDLQSVQPDDLSDSELVEYLRICREHHVDMIYQHMRFTGAAMLPTGDLLAHVGDWTGLPPSKLIGMMRGSAPVSAGASEEFERLIAAVTGDAKARELLDSDEDPQRRSSTDCARSRARPARRSPHTWTSWGTGCSTDSTSAGATRSNCPTRWYARFTPPSKVAARRTRTSRA